MNDQATDPLGTDVAVTHILVVDDPVRSREFWVNALGTELFREYGGTSIVLRFAATWLLLVNGGGPSADEPAAVFTPPRDLDQVSHATTLRVTDCHAVYAALRSRGAVFLTRRMSGARRSASFRERHRWTPSRDQPVNKHITTVEAGIATGV